MPFSLGIKRLSQLVIDAVKDWGGKRIDNVGAPNTDDDVPRARAGDVLSGRFGMGRMPDGTSGFVLKAQGPGVDPVYAALSVLQDAANSAAGDGTTTGYSLKYWTLGDGSESTLANTNLTTTASGALVAVAGAQHGYYSAIYRLKIDGVTYASASQSLQGFKVLQYTKTNVSAGSHSATLTGAGDGQNAICTGGGVSLVGVKAG